LLGLNYCLLHLGLAQLHLGERREAEATWREAAAMAEENFGADSGLKSIADVHLAVALHARGEVGQAAKLLHEALPHVETTDGWLDLYAEGFETATANAIARGDPAAATDLIARMKRTAAARGLSRLEALANAFRTRIPGDAAETGTVPAWEAGRWRNTPSVWREHHAAGVARTIRALQAQRPADALPVLEDLEAAARANDRRRYLRSVAVLRAAALQQQGDEDEALAMLGPVLDAAARDDDTQFLVDLGRSVLPLLQRAWSWSRDHAPGAHGRQVLATAVTTLVRAPQSLDAPGSLSARELEVLVELASGAPNKVIARNLQMTENTVKFHLKNVFQKLPGRHRAEALQAARARGLLR
jgi:LuxR family maltose regulon positive regulatory protein